MELLEEILKNGVPLSVIGAFALGYGCHIAGRFARIAEDWLRLRTEESLKRRIAMAQSRRPPFPTAPFGRNVSGHTASQASQPAGPGKGAPVPDLGATFDGATYAAAGKVEMEFDLEKMKRAGPPTPRSPPPSHE